MPGISRPAEEITSF